MSYPDIQYVKVFDTGEEVELGTIQVAEEQDLSSILLHLFKHGTHSGLEKFKLNIYDTTYKDHKLTTSQVVEVADIESLTPADWIGNVRFDFSPTPRLNTYTTYVITLEPITYTRNGESFYFSAILDWPIELNSNNTPQAGVKMELWGNR